MGAQPFLLSLVSFLVAIPIGIWAVRRVSDALRRHDTALDRLDQERVTAVLAPYDRDEDALQQINELLDDEVSLILEIVDERLRGEHVSPEHHAQLRAIHRKGLAARQRCGDPILNIEVCWLQGYGSLAMTVDVSELDRTRFERELAFRSAELRETLALRQRQRSPAASYAHS
ncbi:MAG: hypothetical protein KC438_03965 [Thermomicrobiales bacterium]|nr:hypothetical protein [Thermomicrobiales bacterium]